MQSKEWENVIYMGCCHRVEGEAGEGKLQEKVVTSVDHSKFL